MAIQITRHHEGCELLNAIHRADTAQRSRAIDEYKVECLVDAAKQARLLADELDGDLSRLQTRIWRDGQNG